MSDYLASLSKAFTQYERYAGSDYNYLIVATNGEDKLGIDLEPAVFAVPYKGQKTTARGLVFRGVRVGAGDSFKDLSERGSYVKQYTSSEGAKVKGSPLFKSLIPLTTEASSSAEFHAFAETAFTKLYDWLTAKVTAAGGVMVIDVEAFGVAFSNSLVPIETTVPDLFHLPGEVPEWAKPKLEAPKPKAGEPDDDIDDEEGNN